MDALVSPRAPVFGHDLLSLLQQLGGKASVEALETRSGPARSARTAVYGNCHGDRFSVPRGARFPRVAGQTRASRGRGISRDPCPPDLRPLTIRRPERPRVRPAPCVRAPGWLPRRPRNGRRQLDDDEERGRPHGIRKTLKGLGRRVRRRRRRGCRRPRPQRGARRRRSRARPSAPAGAEGRPSRGGRTARQGHSAHFTADDRAIRKSACHTTPSRTHPRGSRGKRTAAGVPAMGAGKIAE